MIEQPREEVSKLKMSLSGGAYKNESTVGADASVEALKLYHMKLSYSSLLALLALVACIVQKMEVIDRT